MNRSQGFFEGKVFSTFEKPSMQPGAFRLLHDVCSDSWIHSLSLIVEMRAFPSAVVHSVFTLTPRTLLAGKLSTGKLLITRIKRAVHGDP